MVQAILESGKLPPALLSESLAAAKKDGKTEIAAALEKAGAVMPVVATLTPAQLARYPGTYKSEAGGTVTIAAKDGLVSVSFGGPTTGLSPRSETDFVAEGMPGASATFAFEGDRASTVTIVNSCGGSAVYKRVSQP